MSTREHLVNFIQDTLSLCNHDSFRGGVQYEKGENLITPRDEVHWIIRDEIARMDTKNETPITEWRFKTRSYDSKNVGKGDTLTAFVYDLEKNPEMKRHMEIDNVDRFLCGLNNRYYVRV
jgi:hypothetical protein|tara:strand:+ start:12 stop:371 length:360 start_codon:yes stop_codon:yes gene_type:complete